MRIQHGNPCRAEYTPRAPRTEAPVVDAGALAGRAGPRPAGRLGPREVQQLQRSVGNAAVARLLAGQRSPVLDVVGRGGGRPRILQREVVSGKLNVVGEDHRISNERREEEKEKLAERGLIEDGQYWIETDFMYGQDQATLGDSPVLRMLHSAVELYKYLGFAKDKIADVTNAKDPREALGKLRDELPELVRKAQEVVLEVQRLLQVDPAHVSIEPSIAAVTEVNGFAAFRQRIEALQHTYELAHEPVRGGPKAKLESDELIKQAHGTRGSLMNEIAESFSGAQTDLDDALLGSEYKYDIREGGDEGVKAVETRLTQDRSDQMHTAAEQAANESRTGVWKVGNDHVRDLDARKKSYTLTTEDDFNAAFGFPKTEREKNED